MVTKGVTLLRATPHTLDTPTGMCMATEARVRLACERCRTRVGNRQSSSCVVVQRCSKTNCAKMQRSKQSEHGGGAALVFLAVC